MIFVAVSIPVAARTDGPIAASFHAVSFFLRIPVEGIRSVFLRIASRNMWPHLAIDVACEIFDRVWIPGVPVGAVG